MISSEALFVPVTFSAAELAHWLGYSCSHIYRLNQGEKLPSPIPLRDCLQWDAVEVVDWIVAGFPDRRVWESRRRDTK